VVIAVATALTTVPPHSWELRVFDAINGLPEAPAVVWWPVMQLGALGGAVAMTVVIATLRRPRLAFAYGTSCAIAWLGAEVFKSVVDRARPGDLGIDVVIRGARAVGSGFPSGHSVLVFALLGRWRVVAIALAVIVGLARIYVGAHLPLDVLGGAGVGVLIGVVLHAVAHLPKTAAIGDRR
jgi:undecaprenyl-diphosphatase